MSHNLSQPERFTITGPQGETYRGGNQEWYRDLWQRRAGCGPTTAATLLASTDITPHQAFQAEPGQLALQFHAEADASRMEHWLMGHACELAAARLDVAAIRQDARDLGRHAAAAGQDFFRRWLAGVFTA